MTDANRPKPQALVDALALRERQCRDVVNRLRAAEPLTDLELDEVVHLLREAVELVGCLRRLVPVGDLQALHRAFGAPGDFGYETPIGDALARLYRGES